MGCSAGVVVVSRSTAAPVLHLPRAEQEHTGGGKVVSSVVVILPLLLACPTCYCST